MKFFVDVNGRIIGAELSGEEAIKLARGLVRRRLGLWPLKGFIAIYPHSVEDDDPPPAVLWTHEHGAWRCSVTAEPLKSMLSE